VSGGSYDYVYIRLQDLAADIQANDDPLRIAFKAHLEKVANAMHDIEWVDSGDRCPGAEHDAIRAVLADDGRDSVNTWIHEIIQKLGNLKL
jgi:hypothetical protein